MAAGFGEDFRFGLAALVGERDGGAFQLGDVGAGGCWSWQRRLWSGAQGAGAEVQVEQAWSSSAFDGRAS